MKNNAILLCGRAQRNRVIKDTINFKTSSSFNAYNNLYA